MFEQKVSRPMLFCRTYWRFVNSCAGLCFYMLNLCDSLLVGRRATTLYRHALNCPDDKKLNDAALSAIVDRYVVMEEALGESFASERLGRMYHQIRRNVQHNTASKLQEMFGEFRPQAVKTEDAPIKEVTE